MLIFGRIGESVRVHYRREVAAVMPHHGKIGTLVLAGNGTRRDPASENDPRVRWWTSRDGKLKRLPPKRKGPRNHGVEIEGVVVAIPCGNLYAFPPER